MTNKSRRITMTVFGVFFAGISVGIFDFSVFGMDPFQVFSHGIHLHLNIGFGSFYMLLNLVMLIGIFFLDKTKIGLGTLINIFLLGYVVEFTSSFLFAITPNPTINTRIIALIFGMILLCFASSLYITARLGVSTYDAVALIISEKKNAPFAYIRIASDLIVTLIGFSLGATIGIGTLVTAFFMGPLISFFNKHISIPILNRA